MNITQIGSLIKQFLPNQKITVKGEVNQVKLSHGNLYFNLKDSDSSIRAIIWKYKTGINKDLIKEGAMITVECKLDYYVATGSVSIIIEKVLNNDGLGDLFIKYELIKQDFISRKYFEEARKKKLDSFIRKILIITSADGAALQDFIFNLEKNNCNIDYDVADVPVQGIDCPNKIIKVLGKIKENYDLIIITRGGGSFNDLFGFSQPELIEAVFNFNKNIPILSAIGHQVDNPLLDFVADITVPTPSLAAQFIVDYNMNLLSKEKLKVEQIKLQLIQKIKTRNNELLQLDNMLKTSFLKMKNIVEQLKNDLIRNINEQKMELKGLESKLNSYNPTNQIQLLFNNNIIKNTNELEQFINQTIKLRWFDKEYNIKII